MSRNWVCFFCVVLLMKCLPGYIHADGYARFKKMNEVSREMAKERNQEIVFHGKVVDLNENPVAGAYVEMSVRIFGAMSPQSSFKKFEAVTDKDGHYKIVGFGELIGLEDISMDGYQYSTDYNPKRSVWSAKPHKRKGVGYEPDKPMIFKVRKKGSPSFSLGGSSGRIGLNSGEYEYWDLYLRKSAAESDLIIRNMVNKDWHADIKVSVEQDDSGYRLIFEAIDPESGFAIATYKFEDELKEAPEHGYKPKLVIPIKEGESGGFYAYVKNEGGLFYSKMKASYSHREGNDHVRLESSYVTNMTGGRGFEYSAEFDQQYRNLRKELKVPPLSREQLRDGSIVLPVLEATQ